MEQLPSSIEAYLNEAGFSGTEIFILKKLLGEDALTLRELAAKTGKSTGVLDQAMKKLLKKRIVTREIINDVPKYILQSLQSVQDWMREDMQQKQQMIVRKYENFEAFLATIQKGKQRPEMEYFEGLEGIKRAYLQLLGRGKVLLRYGPTPWSTDEDPLHDFWVEYFRECKKRDVFSRIITHDTPLGRKYQSRDAFEYRQSLLVDTFEYPFKFERIIIGDTVACFQIAEKRACFIRYPELAEEERVFFERLWHQKMAEQHQSTQKNMSNASADAMVVDAIPVRTKLFSQLREFFLSTKGLFSLALCAVLATIFTYGIYAYTQALSFQRIQDKVLSIAATAALQFDTHDLDQLHTVADITKPQYSKVIGQLKDIRNQNPAVKYTYIMRPSSLSGEFEFVADADSLNPYAKIDLNGDGKIDAADHLTPPGEKYDAMQNVSEAMQAMTKPVTIDYVDQWGHFISGWSPIRDVQGKPHAILGLDIISDEVTDLTFHTVNPIYYFIILFLLFGMTISFVIFSNFFRKAFKFI